MGFIIHILLLFAILGGAFTFLFKGKSMRTVGEGMASGVLYAALGLMQLFFIGIFAIAGIWFVTRIL